MKRVITKFVFFIACSEDRINRGNITSDSVYKECVGRLKYFILPIEFIFINLLRYINGGGLLTVIHAFLILFLLLWLNTIIVKCYFKSIGGISFINGILKEYKMLGEEDKKDKESLKEIYILILYFFVIPFSLLVLELLIMPILMKS